MLVWLWVGACEESARRACTCLCAAAGWRSGDRKGVSEGRVVARARLLEAEHTATRRCLLLTNVASSAWKGGGLPRTGFLSA